MGVGRLGAVALCGFVAACGADAPAVGSSSGESTASVDDSTGATPAPTTTTTSDPPADSSGTTPPQTSSESGSEESTGEPLLGAPYPILLAHGFFGFDHLAGIRGVPYWYDVVEFLAKNDETNVCVGVVDPFNDSTTRGELLLQDAIDCAAQTGHAKVNIIAHSQGGLDARVVANLAPELVASVTTIATPHHGTPVADLAVAALDNPIASPFVDGLVQLVGAPLWDKLGQETSLVASMVQMSTEGMIEFNETYPDVEGVLYTSLTGRSSLHSGGDACEPDNVPPPYFIAQWDEERDPIDPLFAFAAAIVSGPTLSEPNDGLVRVIDARWGEFLGCVPADHMDEVGHLLGDDPGLTNDWDHREMYLGLAQYLRLRDL